LEAVTINYVAVVVSAVIAMALGFIWYGPLFGKQWAKEMGWTKDKIESMKKNSNMNRNYALQAVGALLLAYVFAHVIDFSEATGVVAGLQGGFWMWLGFVAPLLLGKVLWEGKSWNLYFLDAGYYLAQLLLMGAILATWV
jgi:hypothetical protein